MGAFMDIVFWGMFVLIAVMCIIVMFMVSKMHEMQDNMEYYRENSNYFTERNSQINKGVDDLHQDISYYLGRLALYKAFLAEHDMVEKFIHWRPLINVKPKESVPPWEDAIDKALDAQDSIRLGDRSQGS